MDLNQQLVDFDLKLVAVVHCHHFVAWSLPVKRQHMV